MMTMPEYAARVEAALMDLFPERTDDALRAGEIPPLLYDSMRYSLLAGGKRLRGSMLLAAVDMLGGDPDQAVAPACAVEMIHASSLIHDDLPAMDDDTMRRGKPANHIVYGEGQAILAGDGLLNMAYEVMLTAARRYPENAINQLAAIGEIARGAGVTKMIGGQSVDLDSERKGAFSEEILEYIQIGKTAGMFLHPLRAAGRLCGAEERAVDALGAFGQAFGRLFQVVDDILDVVGDAALMGKTIGKDEKSGKLTAVRLLGVEGAKETRDALARQAQNALAPFGGKAEFFRALVMDMTRRNT